MKWNYHSSTPIFNNESCPDGIKQAHEVDSGYYAVLNVLDGKLHFIWEDNNEIIVVDDTKPFYIESNRKHHLEFMDQVKFRVDFYKTID